MKFDNSDKIKRYTEAINEWMKDSKATVDEVLDILPNNDTRNYLAVNMLLCNAINPMFAKGFMIGMLFMDMVQKDVIAERESADLEKMLGE